MMSNDSREVPGIGDEDGAGRSEGAGAMTRRDGAPGDGGISARWARIERLWWVALVVTMGIFSALPIVNLALGLSTKDYGLWYQVGLAEGQGLDVYPRPETGRLFPFMYPPSAAAMLGVLARLGPVGMLVALVAINSASWLACIALSTYLVAGPGGRRHPLVVIVPTLSVIVLIHNIYLLGQPNLMLLAMVLGAFACLRVNRPGAAGFLVATAAAVKAFPLLIFGYFVYRRMWRASIATVLSLAAWLLIAPLPFRTLAQAVDDVSVWSQGMLFTYDKHGIAQRPLRSYSYKNQSIMAVMHRMLRDVPADGEAILSGRSHAAPGTVRPTKGLPPVDPSTDLLTFLKPHHRGEGGTSPAKPAARWEEDIRRAEPALRASWRVNLVSLDFRSVTLVTLATMAALSLFAWAMLPPLRLRTRETDALEFAIVALLTVVFSPLSFNYAYVWLMYPTALALHRILGEPGTAVRPRTRGAIAWIAAVLTIPMLAIVAPKGAQACGNLFVPAILLVVGLGLMLRRDWKGSSVGTPSTTPAPHLRPASAGASTEAARG